MITTGKSSLECVKLIKKSNAKLIGFASIIDRSTKKSLKIKNKIIYGLNKIYKEITYKKFEFNKKYEDIHMNIENRLFELIGNDAGYLHAARSRNDQVITDFKIWIKSANQKLV